MIEKIRRLQLVACLIAALGAVAQAQEKPKLPVAETGEINGARFRVDIPENWNGGLVVWIHGYRPAGLPPRLPGDPVEQGQGVISPGESFTGIALGLGYAVAQSAFRVQGFALREGAEDSEALRQYFKRKYGRTYPTIVAGNHMGGLITYDVIEGFPDSYDGALPMGGTAEPRLELMKSRMFDLRLLFDHFLPGLPGSAVEFPSSLTHAGIMARAKELMKQKPEETKLLLRIFGIGNEEGLARTLATYTLILREVYDRAKGNPFDNRNTYYKGSGDDLKLNREIARYQADRAAVEYARQLPAPGGRIAKPVLALNPHGDPVVPIESTHYYDTATQRAGASHLFVQTWVEANGASYKPEEMRRALELLAEWIKHGKRPTPGELKINEQASRGSQGKAK